MATKPRTPKPRRSYTDEERANALAALAANGGSVKKTAGQLGIPEVTLRQWARGRRHPEATQMSAEKRGPMADRLEDIAWQLLDAIPDKITHAPLSQTATAMGIAIDKARLLRGEPTSIDEHRDDDRLAEFRRRYAAGNAGDARTPVGPDGGREPDDPPPADDPADPVP